MRKNWIVGLAGAALLAVMPATALAHGPHAKHHAKGHRVHTRIRHLQAAGTGASSTSPTSGSSTDSAGSVTSFDGTTLVVTLTNGSTVTGTVTSDTEMSCESSSQSTSMQSDMRSDGGSQDASNSQGGNDQGGSGDQGGGQGGSGDQGDQDDNGNQAACTTANLTPGTAVHEADLKLSSAGSVWAKVDLITG